VVKVKKLKPRNEYARALQSPLFRNRVIANSKAYARKTRSGRGEMVDAADLKSAP
jgi:stalled ribosome alternative rescue factor ArfA